MKAHSDHNPASIRRSVHENVVPFAYRDVAQELVASPALRRELDPQPCQPFVYEPARHASIPVHIDSTTFPGRGAVIPFLYPHAQESAPRADRSHPKNHEYRKTG